MRKNKIKNNEILVSSLYLFYDMDNSKLIATTSQNYDGIPFIICPEPESASERYSYQMYPTNNLYFIISNGGVELNQGQINAINRIKTKVIGNDYFDRIGNEKTATLTKDEITELMLALDVFVTKKQLKEITNKQIDSLIILQS